MGKVLVSGGAGFIGGHTVDALVADGYDVRVMDCLTEPVHPRGCPPLWLNEAVEYQLGDVRDKRHWVQALQGVTHVIHLAAYQDYRTDFSTFFDVNAVGTALLYEVALEQKIPLERVVIASSQAVYGEAAYHCPGCREKRAMVYPAPRPEARLKRGLWEPFCPHCGGELSAYDHTLPILEKTAEGQVNPANSYAISKVTQEQIGFTLGARYGIPTTCLRYSIVQGPRQSFTNAYSGILRIFTQRLAHGQRPVCYEDGRQLRDYVSVKDVVRANLRVMLHPAAIGEAFNIGGDRAISVLEYAEWLCHKINPELLPWVSGEYRYGDTRHVRSDVGKAARLLGWSPDVSLDTIIDDYVSWALAEEGFGDYTSTADAAMRAMGCVRKGDA